MGGRAGRGGNFAGQPDSKSPHRSRYEGVEALAGVWGDAAGNAPSVAPVTRLTLRPSHRFSGTSQISNHRRLSERPVASASGAHICASREPLPFERGRRSPAQRTSSERTAWRGRARIEVPSDAREFEFPVQSRRSTSARPLKSPRASGRVCDSESAGAGRRSSGTPDASARWPTRFCSATACAQSSPMAPARASWPSASRATQGRARPSPPPRRSKVFSRSHAAPLFISAATRGRRTSRWRRARPSSGSSGRPSGGATGAQAPLTSASSARTSAVAWTATGARVRSGSAWTSRSSACFRQLRKD